MTTITLAPMNEKEFNLFWDATVPRYAQSVSKAHHISFETALEKAASQTGTLLYEGLQTSNHYFFQILCDQASIGNLWIYIDVNTNSAFLYEIFIVEEGRGKRIGYHAIKKAEEWLFHEKGVSKFGLHVFAYNERAHKLYQKLGFQEISFTMSKTLEP
ncbi:GNAT family N-acetyltransferase [Priestia koreensis]|uniref:GNAT family N-acetyltransferase n=1 Tax=Priestia koreensis TaxID=284581 RepID=UPI0028F747BE|nr:GNAT family N-acetyltransferase [Priestia koreensis]